MPGAIAWDERFKLGIPEIDDQHKKMFEIIDSVFDAIGENRDREALAEAFDRVLDYTRYHFSTEERYLDRYGYPDAEEHKNLHARLIKETLELKERYTEGCPSITIELIDFLTEWLQHHILLHDKKFAPFINAKLDA